MADWQALYPFKSHWFSLPADPTAPPRDPDSAPLPTVRMHYIDECQIAECQIAAQETVTAADLPTVLCVHGNPTWSFYYRQVAIAQRSRARVIAVDHLGCGMSDKPQVYPYCLQQHIGNLTSLITQLDLQRITLVVHDWGGAIGLGAALKVPERIAGLVILNTAAFPPPYIPWRIAACRLPYIGNWAMRQLNLFARAALTMTLNRLPKLPDDVAAGLIAPYDSYAHRVAIARFVQDIPTRSKQATWQVLAEIESRLPKLADRPAELVWGMKDWCFRPECLDRLSASLPRANVNRLDDVGHYVMEEAASEVNAAIERVLEAQR